MLCKNGVESVEVLAPNGAASLLYQKLLDYSGNPDKALELYLRANAPRVKSTLTKMGFVLDMNGEFELDNVVAAALDVSIKKQVSLSDVEEANKFIELKENSDGTSEYIDRRSGKIFRRLTEFITAAFSNKYKDSKLLPHEAAAESIMTRQGKNGKVTYKTKEYDLEGLKAVIKVEHETGRVYGNIIHALIEKFISPSKKLRLEADIAEMAAGQPGVQNPIRRGSYAWVEDYMADIFKIAGLNFADSGILEGKDKMLSEVTVHSPSIGVATKIDGLVEHSDGTFSIVDWKSGQYFTSDMYTNILANFGGQYSDIHDSKLDRARMEVLLRAVMLKEAHPEMKFRMLRVVHLEKDNGPATNYDVPIDSYLKALESYFEQHDKELFNSLTAKDLFNPRRYETIVDTDTKDKGLDIESRIKWRLDEIAQKRNRIKGAVVAGTPDSNRIIKLTKEIANLKAGRALEMNVDLEDMGWFKRWAGNFYGIGNPLLQAYYAIIQDRKNKARMKIQAINRKHDALLDKVLQDYYQRNPTTKLLNYGVIGGIQYSTLDKNGTKKGTGLYDFMYKFRVTEERSGWGVVTETDAEWGTLTVAQKEYIKFFQENITAEYNKTMNAVAYYERGKPVTKAQAAKRANSIDGTFFPRVPAQLEEVWEKGNVFRNVGKYLQDSITYSLTESQNYGKNNNIGLPIKYMETAESVSNMDNTFNAEIAFKQFMANMVMKDELDSVQALGDGLVAHIKNYSDENGKKMDNTVGFLEDQIMLQVLDVKKEMKPSRKPIRITIGGKTHEISIDKVLDMLKSVVSAGSMWIQPANGTANFAMIIILGKKEALKGTMAMRLAGVDSEDIDFTMKDLLWAEKEWAAYIGRTIRPGYDPNTDKLHLLLKKFDYLPDNYDYANRKNSLVTSKNKAFDSANLYKFHSIGEEFGSMTIFLAQMHHMKNIDGKSMWDSYKVENGEAVWVGGKRGEINTGIKDAPVQELYELTSLEITKLKRVSARIHGGYRQDERSALELHALGRWVLQFKRYLPSILENIFQGKYEDATLGRYKLNKDNKYEWHGRINEGRAWVLGKLVLNLTKLKTDPDYKWEKLSPEQKQHVLEMLSTALFMAGAVATYAAAFDDDEKNTYMAKKSRILIENISQGYHPLDLLRNLQNQTVVLPQLFKVADAFSKFMVDGVIDGETTDKGDMPGSTTLIKRFPVWNLVPQYEDATK